MISCDIVNSVISQHWVWPCVASSCVVARRLVKLRKFIKASSSPCPIIGKWHLVWPLGFTWPVCPPPGSSSPRSAAAQLSRAGSWNSFGWTDSMTKWISRFTCKKATKAIQRLRFYISIYVCIYLYISIYIYTYCMAYDGIWLICTVDISKIIYINMRLNMCVYYNILYVFNCIYMWFKHAQTRQVSKCLYQSHLCSTTECPPYWASDLILVSVRCRSKSPRQM